MTNKCMCYKGGGAAPNWTSRPGQTTSYQGTSSQIDNITVHKYHNYFFPPIVWESAGYSALLLPVFG